MVYLLDANIFIQAKNQYYGLDFCPAFWDWLVRENAAGKVSSLDKVYDELKRGKDDLSDWADAHKALFLPVSPAAPSVAGKISDWVTGRNPSSPPYKPAAQSEFLAGNADYWLIAHAMAEGDITIVSHETASPAGVKRVKIPDVCSEFSVPCILPFEMLRAESAQFVLLPTP